MAGTTANSVMVGLTRTDAVYNNPQVPQELIEIIEAEFIPGMCLDERERCETCADPLSILL